ncbi:preprotein translocase subunit SecG [bacterium]|nr:preprotein translocase subunit SecG [bacterium]MBQ6436527.1 preprotein translocase subunit SecG [bacterium]
MILACQVILGVIIIACVLLQTQDAGLGFWGGGGETYTTKRGLEKVIFYVTIACIVLFVFLSLLSLTLGK